MTAKEISEKIFYSPATNGQAKASIEQGEKMIQEYAKKQLMLGGVGSSTFKVAITDSHCTYDFEMKLPKTTCIRDISKRLYASFGLKEEQGQLRK
jgi:hypothetical protein